MIFGIPFLQFFLGVSTLRLDLYIGDFLPSTHGKSRSWPTIRNENILSKSQLLGRPRKVVNG